jgi:hypothetical protein
LRFYALAEAGIGLSALTVPYELAWGRSILAAGSGVAWDSATYYVASGAWVALALLPFCVAMGATFPLAMAAIRGEGLAGSDRSFSFLYLANVLGATSGTVVSAFLLVEIFGFAATLLVTALINLLLAGAAMYRSGLSPIARPPVAAPSVGRESRSHPPAITVALLFLTGLTSMALEVAWIRQFTPYLGTLVYAFAAILGVYLIANFAGSALYRIRASVGQIDRPARGFVLAWAIVGFLALVPLLTADPRLPLHGVTRLVLGIVPFCVGIGFLTPMLVDWWSAGDPDRAGQRDRLRPGTAPHRLLAAASLGGARHAGHALAAAVCRRARRGGETRPTAGRIRAGLDTDGAARVRRVDGGRADPLFHHTRIREPVRGDPHPA